MAFNPNNLALTIYVNDYFVVPFGIPDRLRLLWLDLLFLSAENEPIGYLTDPDGKPLDDEAIFLRLRCGACAANSRHIARKRAAFVRQMCGLLARRYAAKDEAGTYYIPWLVRKEEIRAKCAAGGGKSLDNPNVPRPRKGTLPDDPEDILRRGERIPSSPIPPGPRPDPSLSEDPGPAADGRRAEREIGEEITKEDLEDDERLEVLYHEAVEKRGLGNYFAAASDFCYVADYAVRMAARPEDVPGIFEKMLRCLVDGENFDPEGEIYGAATGKDPDHKKANRRAALRAYRFKVRPAPDDDEVFDFLKDDTEEAWKVAARELPKHQSGIKNAHAYITKCRKTAKHPRECFPWFDSPGKKPERLCEGCGGPMEKLPRRTGSTICLYCERLATGKAAPFKKAGGEPTPLGEILGNPVKGNP